LRLLILAISTLLLVAVGGGVVAWTRLTSFLESPGKAAPAEKVVAIPANAGGQEIISILTQEGLIDHPDWMRFYVDHFAKQINAKPGEYALSPSMSPIDLIKKIESGKVVTYTVTIPPGATINEISALLAEKKLGDAAELKAIARDKKTADELRVPNDTLEGFLFPEVYDIPRAMNARALLEMFVARYRKFVTAGILDSARKNDLTEHDLLTLASLIEKSDVLQSEQRVYSALLHNRLKQKKPLDVKAALEYGLALEGLDLVRATKQEIKASPWNLAVVTGLPPGPICSPSLPSIVAASEPADSPALYMVRRTDGTHVFCPDLECYEAAKKEWRSEQK
jgi:UPF0755 protein